MFLGRVFPVLALLLLLRPAVAADEIARQTLTFDGRERTYHVYAPAASGPTPMVVLLHGSGSQGAFLAQYWKDTASRNGFVLLAPDSLHPEIGWDLRTDGPDYIRAVMARVTAAHAIDPRRIYLFGQSGGAVYALELGMLESEFFAAVAIHAGAWRHIEEYKAADYAARKIPVSIAVGDQDVYFPLDSVRNTERVLAQHGIPIDVTILKNGLHAYSNVPPDFADTTWGFLGRHALESDPKYADYAYRPGIR
ncbi:MAG TPA: PHB depolymerase family esterase [Rhizomicrobium sp.]|jgi:poly(3-hydroxybutyrate) depolymerase